jgi:hypothetical protein
MKKNKKKNEILEEVWRNRDEFAREHNYDLDAMVAALQEMEKHPLSRIVDRRPNAPRQPSDKQEDAHP